MLWLSYNSMLPNECWSIPSSAPNRFPLAVLESVLQVSAASDFYIENLLKAIFGALLECFQLKHRFQMGTLETVGYYADQKMTFLQLTAVLVRLGFSLPALGNRLWVFSGVHSGCEAVVGPFANMVLY